MRSNWLQFNTAKTEMVNSAQPVDGNVSYDGCRSEFALTQLCRLLQYVRDLGADLTLR